MATKTQNLSEKYQELLQNSQTAYDPGVDPTESDIDLQKKLMQANIKDKTAEAETLKGQWYGDNEMDADNDRGYLSGVLKTLGAPLYGIVGGVEALTGKGTEKGLANIWANIEEEGTFGDLLRNSGVSNSVAMPLGLALDLAADPLNWFTLGATSFVPKTFLGAKAGLKTTGAIKGAATGAKSGALSSLEKIGRAIPGLQKRSFAVTDKGKFARSGVVTSRYRKLSQNAVNARHDFENLMGKSLIQRVDELAKRDKWGDRVLRKIGETNLGADAIKAGKYSPQDWLEKAIALENGKQATKAVNAASDPFDILLGKKSGANIVRQVNNSKFVAKHPNVAKADDSYEFVDMLKGEAAKDKEFKTAIQARLDDLRDRLLEGDDASLAKLATFSTDTKEGLERSRRLTSLFETFKGDIHAYDKRVAKIILSEKGRAFLSTHAKFIGLFKNAKIGGNLLTAGVNATVGNLAMTGMIGIDILNTNFFSSMTDAIKIIKGTDKTAINKLLTPEWRELLEANPTVFEAIHGINPNIILRGRAYIEEVGQDLLKATKNRKDLDGITDVGELYDKTMAKIINKGEKGVSEGETVGRMAFGDIQAAERSARSTTDAFLQRGRPTTFMSTEMLRGPYADFVKQVEKLGKEGKPFAKAFHWYLTKPMEAYNKFDQTYKLGLALHLTRNGISEQELYRLGKRVNLVAEDITEVPGRNLFKLSPQKAMAVSNEAYMNYLAMPGFVQIMRTLPLMGSPFFSFAYGMSALTAKTAVHNPAFFNKVQFMLQEISGAKSPLEKQQLDDKYYNWLDRPGMVKLPFFKDNPFYLNMENMIPYYTMNVFQPVERTYKNRFGGAVAKLLDKSPFMKSPDGQVLFDYVIQPMMISGEQPKGMFNQPLWKIDDPLIAKFGRGTMAAMETVLPPLAGYAGQVMPSEIAKFAPLYRLRQLAYAREGKTSLGVPSKIPASERAAQVRRAMAGWPTYQIKLKYNK